MLFLSKAQLQLTFPPKIWGKIATVFSYHIRYAFQSESTLYSCLNVKELLAQSRLKIWTLIDCNWTVKCTVQISTHNITQNHYWFSYIIWLFFSFIQWVENFQRKTWGFMSQKWRFTNHVFLLKSQNLKFNVTWTIGKYIASQTREYDY